MSLLSILLTEKSEYHNHHQTHPIIHALNTASVYHTMQHKDDGLFTTVIKVATADHIASVMEDHPVASFATVALVGGFCSILGHVINHH